MVWEVAKEGWKKGLKRGLRKILGMIGMVATLISVMVLWMYWYTYVSVSNYTLLKYVITVYQLYSKKLFKRKRAIIQHRIMLLGQLLVLPQFGKRPKLYGNSDHQISKSGVYIWKEKSTLSTETCLKVFQLVSHRVSVAISSWVICLFLIALTILWPLPVTVYFVPGTPPYLPLQFPRPHLSPCTPGINEEVSGSEGWEGAERW